MHIYYRISDNSYEKSKLPGTDKRICFDNFNRVFKDYSVDVIADNCSKETLDWLDTVQRAVHVTNLGNAGSLQWAIKLTIEQLNPNSVVYFCEDDYLHQDCAPQLIQEIQDKSDYFTLYDHPDKYTSDYAYGETSKVIRTNSSHWRFTQSTCMTFGAKVKTLKEDLSVWEKFTSGNHPHDHFIFTELSQQGRLLAVAIPGVACHTDLTFSNEKGGNLIEPWAIGIAVQALRKRLGIYEPAFADVGTWKDLTFLAMCAKRQSDGN